MTEIEHTPGPVDSLIADFRLAIKRLKEAPLKSLKDVNQELIFNTYPSMIALAEQIAEVDDVIQEVVEQQDSYIHPSLAAQILSTVAAGGVLIEEIKKIPLDDLQRKRLDDLVAQFEHSAELTIMGVSDATTDADADEDEPEEAPEDGEDDAVVEEAEPEPAA